MNEPVEYPGKDLEAMDIAGAYRRWVLDGFRPFLGKSIVEVGAGIGSFSRELLATHPESLTLVEPSSMFERLQAAFGGLDGVRLYNDRFANVATEIRDSEPDSIIYINVLEHIEDDIRELEIVRETLVPHGRVLLFVPALAALFSKLDAAIGHHRRYSRQELEQKVVKAGFHILETRWFDIAGVAPWFIKYRLFGSTDVGIGAVRAYDKIAVPIMRPLEKLVPPPIGKNILLVAERD